MFKTIIPIEDILFAYVTYKKPIIVDYYYPHDIHEDIIFSFVDNILKIPDFNEYPMIKKVN